MEAFLMKNLGMILKILAVIVAIAGAIYVIVVYGDKIADGVKKAVKFVKKKFFDKDRADFADLAEVDVFGEDFED
jgi:hypothetical protein